LYRRFRAFLRSSGCEHQFDRAFYAQCGANVLDETLAEMLVIDETFINRCFDWAKTQEGREYWKRVDGLWWEVFLDEPCQLSRTNR